MQLVVELSEEDYEVLKQGSTFTKGTQMTRVYEALWDATPLPKGHGRLKDIDRLESHDEYDGQGFTKSVYKDDIDSAQTIIEADKGE